MDEFTPLPLREQKRRERAARRLRNRNARRQRWVDSRDRRLRAYRSFKSAGRRALTLAISVLGATLVSYATWTIYHQAGYLTAGILIWVLQWNYGSHGRGEG